MFAPFTKGEHYEVCACWDVPQHLVHCPRNSAQEVLEFLALEHELQVLRMRTQVVVQTALLARVGQSTTINTQEIVVVRHVIADVRVVCPQRRPDKSQVRRVRTRPVMDAHFGHSILECKTCSAGFFSLI